MNCFAKGLASKAVPLPICSTAGYTIVGRLTVAAVLEEVLRISRLLPRCLYSPNYRHFAFPENPYFTLSVAYALGPVLRADSSPQKRFRPAILLYDWIDIHS